VAVESSSLAYSISLDLLHIVGHLNVKNNTFYIADYLRFPGLNFGAIFSVTRYMVNAGLRGNGIHMTYATYMVYVVQKCSLYGRLYDGFVRTWKSTLSATITASPLLNSDGGAKVKTSGNLGDFTLFNCLSAH
jgi:hypothetical protein